MSLALGVRCINRVCCEFNRVSCSQSRRADNRKMNSLFVSAAARSQDRGREARGAEAEGVCAEVLHTVRVLEACACAFSSMYVSDQHITVTSSCLIPLKVM